MIFICCFKILPLFVYLRKSVKVTQGSLLQVYMDKLNEKEKIVGTKTMPNLYVISNSHYYKQELLEYFHAANIYLCSYKIIKNISLSLGTLVRIKKAINLLLSYKHCRKGISQTERSKPFLTDTLLLKLSHIVLQNSLIK